MNRNKIIAGLFLCGILIKFCCGSRNHSLELSLGSIDSETEIDTVEAYPNRGLFLLNIIHLYTFGRFSMSYAIVKHVGRERMLVYNLDKPRNQEDMVSPRYISYVKPVNEMNWGWFKIENGKIANSLPRMNEIVDSLQRLGSDSNHVNDRNGYIFIYRKGKVINRMNYGQFVLTGKVPDPDSLEYKLYQLDGGALKIKSDDADDLFKQKSGIYFIPSPGYGLISKYNKQEVFDAVDSAARMEHPLSRITIKPAL